jgi:LmbE family N-acetylglucosaminyl deacetylase
MKERLMAKFPAILAVSAVLSIAATLLAQSRPGFPSADAVEATNQARVVTRILYITAHPDDEDSGLLAYLARGIDADVALLTITRGQGGQNAVGPEQDGQLGVVRTTELLEAGKHYGVHQYFTRAVDTGFSKSPKWTMAIWGDQLPMEDMVRVIRTYRPDVVINGWGGVKNGHGQHQASGILTPTAVAEASDLSKFADQLSEGLPAWKTSLELRPANFNFGPGSGRGGRGDGAPAAPPPSVRIPTDEISPLWGISYVEMGAEGHGQQPSQGTPQLFGGGFGRRQSSLVTETPQGEPGGVFDPKLLDQPITSLADRYPSFKSVMAPALASADQDLATAATQELSLDRTAAAHSLAEAGKQIAGLTDEISQQSGDDKSQLLFDLAHVREKIDKALTMVVSPSIALNADRHELVAGESFSVTASFPDKPAVDVQAPIAGSNLEVPSGWTVGEGVAPAPQNGRGRGGAGGGPGGPNAPRRFSVTIPADATIPPVTPAEAILPFPTPLVRFVLPVSLDNYTFNVVREVEYSETKTVRVETYPLEMVPAVTLTVEPPEIMVSAKHASAPIKLFARVRYHGEKPAKVSIGVDEPKGWAAQPIPPLDFAEAGDQLVQYVITPTAGVKPGAYRLHPFAKLDDETFRTSLEAIPTLPTRDWSEPNDATVHVLNLNIPAGLHIGYVAADNDPLPEVLRQTGIQVDLLDEVALSFDDLSHYDAIVIGIRAYELRPDVARANARLLDYVKNGGSLVVQYEREPAWGQIKAAPYPAAMDAAKSNTLARTTDPASEVGFLAPENPLLNTPNKITQDDFKDWVQERGTYYWDTWDSHYTPILALQDPDEPPVNGALMYARYGKGVYIYAGLVFFRELPAGVPGAYRLFVNLISQTPHMKQ